MKRKQELKVSHEVQKKPPGMKILEEEGLAAALKKLSGGVFKQAGISFTFSENNFSKKLSREKELQLYRIVQEIFTNILKHARASEVQIKLYEQKMNAAIEITDNGIGFNEDEAREKGGAGLFNIYSRIRNIGGHFIIESNNPAGSRFLIECPL